MNQDEVRFRLLRSDDTPPTNPLSLPYRFGLQDTKQNIVEGIRRPDGLITFDFTLKVKKGDDSQHPVFTGRFASGPPEDRFVYLSWWAIGRGNYINRVKARLDAIDRKMIRESQEQDRPVTADMTGWIPGDARQHVSWSLA